MPSLRSLRLQVTVAVVVAAAACAYVTSKNSNGELHGAYRDSARHVLQGVTADFERGYEYGSEASVLRLRNQLKRLLAAHTEVQSANLYRPGRENPAQAGGPADFGTEVRLATEAINSGEQAVAEAHGNGVHAETLVTPLEADGQVVGALSLGYDLKPAHVLLDERSERMLIVLGLLLLAAEAVGRRERDLAALTRRDAIVIGFAQALALIPGVSRSGATMSAGLLLGLQRPAAAKFGFLLAIPAVVASGLFQLEGIISGEEGGDEPFSYVAIATVISFAVGYAAIAWFLRYLAHHSVSIFVGYRILLGALVLALVAAGAIG